MGSFFDHFMVIYDPRQEGKIRYKLMDILFITVAATVCKCDEWEEIEEWAIVTIDAMGCQKDIATKIVKEKKADYVLSLKDNHETLKSEVEEYFKDAEQNGFKNDKILQYSTLEKGHVHIEERLYYYSTDIRWMDAKKDWTKLTGIGMVIRRV